MADYAVALSGGIASGKSAVGAAFAAQGVAVVDTDLGARAVVAPGTPGLASVIATFGSGVLAADGSLDRRRLRAIVFADAAARQQLEAILHPLIRTWSRREAGAAIGPYVIVTVPLLAETWPAYAWVNRVAVVTAPRELRITRLRARDDIDRTQAEAMLAAQADDAARLALADDVIHNDGEPARLRAAVAELHPRYLRLAAAARARP